MSNDVFDDHYRAVDHHAEIQRAQGEKIGGNFVEIEANGGKQQRKGNGERNNDGAANIAEKEEKNYGNQQHAFGQVVKHGMRGQVHQVAAVQERDDLYPRRENALVQLLHFFVNGYEGFVRIGALAQQDDSFDRIVAIHYRAVRASHSFADLPQANPRALRDDADVLYADRRSVLCFDQRLFDVPHVRK